MTTEISQSSGPIRLVANETVIKKWEDRMERAVTTASSLEAKQDSGNINRNQSIATLNESFPQGTDSSSGPRYQDTTLEGVEAQIRFKTASKQSNDPPLSRVNTLGSGEDNMKLKELMDLCTKLPEKNTATARILDNGDMEITATIDGKVKIVSEASIRRHLKLEDSDSISNLPTSEIFEQLALMGYASNSDKLTFQKGHFSPQWRFLIHTILHCLSSKKTAWEQFSSNIATAIICLATNRTFNFSKMIFDGMVKNLESKHKFLMYPRFIQVFLNKHKRLLLPHNRTYIAPTLTQKLFSNMRRASKGYTGVDIPLFPTMLVQGLVVQGEGSTVPVESHHTPTSAPPTSPPPSSSPSRRTTKQESMVPQPISPTQTNVADEAASIDVDVRDGGATTISCSFGNRLKQTKKDYEVCIAEKGVSTVELVSTAGALVSTVGASSAKDKGKAIIEESETIQTKTKLQLEQERLGYEEALRLQAEIDEEERQRIARYIKNMGSHTLKKLKSYSFDEIKNLFEITIRRVYTFVPMKSESERVIPELAAKSSKRDTKEELVQESSKRLKTGESLVPAEEPKDKEEEDLSQERIYNK
ncbi:hypothetical protein Tco_1403012 [Tanacetum coccineum]